MATESEAEMQGVRAQEGILTFAELELSKAENLAKALKAARRLCPTGPVVYAAKLLGISRSRFRRFRQKYGIGAARE